MLGEAKDQDESILQLSCNVDDMTAEEIGYAMDCLFKEGALEVFTVPVGMKKCRPGILLNVLCRPADREKMVQAIFKYSSTIGIREETMRRYTLQRSISAVDTPFGQVRRKISSGYGVRTVKYEYEDLARIASERNISISAVKDMLKELGQDGQE
ncbi:MAG: DUF111 family protein [Victivallales bacterium]|nr:DUF111 family protein [Victivallales bacterium]